MRASISGELLKERKGGMWAECGQAPVEDWMHEVAEGNTRLGYWEWAAVQLDESEVTYDDDSLKDKLDIDVDVTETWEQAEELAKRWNRPTFNLGPHLFVDVKHIDVFTITARYNGIDVTFGFVPRDRSTGDPECVDIRVHHDYGTHKNVNGEDVPNQRAIMIKNGRTRHENFDLVGILLNSEYLRKEGKLNDPDSGD
jgi:hypothetical protein